MEKKVFRQPGDYLSQTAIISSGSTKDWIRFKAANRSEGGTLGLRQLLHADSPLGRPMCNVLKVIDEAEAIPTNKETSTALYQQQWRLFNLTFKF